MEQPKPPKPKIDPQETLRRLSPENFRQAQIEADKRAAERAKARLDNLMKHGLENLREAAREHEVK